MCAKVSESLREFIKVSVLHVKLDIIRHIWHDLVGYIWGLGTLKIFSILMVIISLFYIISAYERFHRNPLLLDSRGNPKITPVLISAM